jgi:hypothetical protein
VSQEEIARYQAEANAIPQRPPTPPRPRLDDPFYRAPNRDSYPQRLDRNGNPVPEGFLVTPTGVIPMRDTGGKDGLSQDGARWPTKR